jgi:hypothetical protein
MRGFLFSADDGGSISPPSAEALSGYMMRAVCNITSAFKESCDRNIFIQLIPVNPNRTQLVVIPLIWGGI